MRLQASKRFPFWLITTVAGVLLAAPGRADVTVNAVDRTVHLTNGQVHVEFDLDSGQYRLADDTGQPVVTGAALAVDHWSAREPRYEHTWTSRPDDDAIGQGKTVTIISRAAAAPTLVLEMTLYDGKGFVVLNAGLENTLAEPLQIKALHPLGGAQAFAGVDTSAHFSMLDGNSGGDLTRVTHADELGCDNNLLVTFGAPGTNRSLVVGGLTYHEFEKYAYAARKPGHLVVDVYSQDHVGKRIDPGTTYLPDERYYIDFNTSCPFEALEQYARTVRVAQGVDLNLYDFPTLCLWYTSMGQYGAGALSNDSVGAVWEMDQAIKRGFLKYSRLAIRLVPDNYDPNNQQGWWDDTHWQMYQNYGGGGPCYRAPYETTAKWAGAIIERGGIPLMYCQSGRRSEDYAATFPDQMLFDSGPAAKLDHQFWWDEMAGLPSYWGYDYTDPGFQAHMREVYANLRRGGVKGWMFDYPETAYPYQGGMEDPYSTTAGAYRTMFRLGHEGLGQPNWLHERNLGVGSDITLGVVASQRTMGDTDRINPTVVSTPGLRWYKNRVLYSYDMDGKNPFHTVPDGPDGVRALFTMTYVAGGRLLLACSFTRMTDEHLHALTRAFPYHTTPQSARPIDAFVGGEFPQVYDFAVTPKWHQVTFYNTAVSEGAWSASWEQLTQKGDEVTPAASTIAVDLGGEPAFGGLGLDPGAQYYVYDFWNDRLVGKLAGNGKLEQTLRPGEARMMSVHQVESRPQFLSTNRHLMQGYVDMTSYPVWNEAARTLSATSRIVGGETYKVIIALNGYTMGTATARNAAASVRVVDPPQGLIELALRHDENREVDWTVSFE